jgi:hypothetical protein
MIAFGGQTKRDLRSGKVAPRCKITQDKVPSLTAKFCCRSDASQCTAGSETGCDPAFIFDKLIQVRISKSRNGGP